MTNFSATTIPTLLASYDFSPFGTVVDVAGGRGHLLGAILKAHRNTKGILFDLPHAADGAKRHLTSLEVADRCQIVQGDFFKSVPSGGDAYLLKHIVHDWDDERASAILTGCRRAMTSKSKLLVLEMVLPPGNEPYFGKILDLEMLVLTLGGRERTAEEYRKLFERAGLALGRIVPTQSPVSIIEATVA